MSSTINHETYFNYDDIVVGGVNTEFKSVNDFLKGEDNIRLEKVFDLDFTDEDCIIMEDKPLVDTEVEPEVKKYEGLDEPIDESVILISKTGDKFKVNKNQLIKRIILFDKMLSDGTMELDEMEFNVDNKYLSFVVDTLNYYSTKKFPVLKDSPVEDKFESLLKIACKDDMWLVNKLQSFNFNDMLTILNFLNYLGYIKLFEICCAKLASFITNKTCAELWDLIEPVKYRFEKFPMTRQQMVEIDNKGEDYIEDMLSERIETAIKLYEEKHTKEREAKEYESKIIE